MEGFDILLITNLLAVPAFQKAFGVQLAVGSYQIISAWQSGLTTGALIGVILGLTINGLIADRFGYRKTMIGALDRCHRLYLHCVLCTEPCSAHNWLDLDGHPLGCLPDTDHYLRR